MSDDTHSLLPLPELSPGLSPASDSKPAGAGTAAPPRGGPRDFLETIVFFLVICVLLLKTFVAEAYVIPTGSMATTLWGNQKDVECPQCGYSFPVNSSSEADTSQGPPVPVTGCTCPNCRYEITWPVERDEASHTVRVQGPAVSGGDRVLVSKCVYDLSLGQPDRQDVVVFKYPRTPQREQSPLNYIKRLIGKPGETIGIWYGDLYVAEGLHAPPGDPALKFELREPRHMHIDEDVALLKRDAVAPAGDPRRQFRIIRKTPAQVLTLRRLVHDNAYVARDLVGKLPPRWAADTGSAWTADHPDRPQVFQHTPAERPDIGWLRYRHILRPTGKQSEGRPELITDFLGYNTGKQGDRSGSPPVNWVGDLILECQVEVAQPIGELWLELSRGVDRFQARFHLPSGACTLFRIRGGAQPLASAQPTRLGQPGVHQLRLANVDERLTLWVDGDLPFGDGIVYDPPSQRGPAANDLEPASVGAFGAAVSVSQLRLWRDTYYTLSAGQADAVLPVNASWGNPRDWGKLRDLPARTMYVQPGHYLCLGDNSLESSDSRDWGLVPERLLLGRALLVLYPFNRAGPIR
jgi:signal peptidase I